MRSLSASLALVLLLLAPAGALAAVKLPACVTTASDPDGCEQDGYHTCRSLSDDPTVWLCTHCPSIGAAPCTSTVMDVELPICVSTASEPEGCREDGYGACARHASTVWTCGRPLDL